MSDDASDYLSGNDKIRIYYQPLLERTEEECCDLRSQLIAAQKVIQAAYVANQNLQCFGHCMMIQAILDNQTAILRDCKLRTECLS